MDAVTFGAALATANFEKTADKNQPLDSKMGPLQGAYIADAVGAESNAKGLNQVYNHPDVATGGAFDAYMSHGAGAGAPIQRRIQHAASRFAENRRLRLLAALDPTQLITDNPDISLTTLLSGTGKINPEREDIVKQRYKTKIHPNQDTVDSTATGTKRDTPWHRGMQGQFANLDSDVAGHATQRKESPLNYWLNPLDRTGPLNELGDRISRRVTSAVSEPDSTLGRVGMQVGTVGTLGLLPMIMGGHDAQNKIRRSAKDNDVYSDVATPRESDPKAYKEKLNTKKKPKPEGGDESYAAELYNLVRERHPDITEEDMRGLSNLEWGILSGKIEMPPSVDGLSRQTVDAPEDISNTAKAAAAYSSYFGAALATANFEKTAANANDIVDMDSTGGLLADYLSPTAWGGERAGRSQSMATAIDEPSTFGVRHPYTQTTGYATGGGLLGALGGAGIAALPGLFGRNYSSDHLYMGSGIGGVGGAIIGAGLAGHNRRKAMANTNTKYDMANEEGEVKPKNPDFSWLSALLAPLRGPHRTGQLEAVRAMKGNGTIGEQHGKLRDLLYSAHHWPTPVGAMAGGAVAGLHGLSQNVKTQFQDGDTNKAKVKKPKPGSPEAYKEKLNKKKKDKSKANRDGDKDGKINDGTPQEKAAAFGRMMANVKT